MTSSVPRPKKRGLPLPRLKPPPPTLSVNLPQFPDIGSRVFSTLVLQFGVSAYAFGRVFCCFLHSRECVRGGLFMLGRCSVQRELPVVSVLRTFSKEDPLSVGLLPSVRKAITKRKYGTKT